MATATSQASQYWHQALKMRKHLLKHLEKLQAETTLGIDISQFEAIEGLLEKFRLAFVHTIFLDFAYAVKENSEEALWTSHTSINTEYRRIQSRLKHSSHTVERRKLEKSYNNFLRVAQKFYKGYIQRLAARYDVPELRRVAQGIDVEQMDSVDQISPIPAKLQAMVLKSCHSTLLRIGDLSRYRTQARHKNSGYETALTYYSLAHHIKPHSGYAHHQMGIVHLDQGNHLDIVYHFYRAWAVESPHPNAQSNLELEFKSLQLPNSSKSRHNAATAQDAFSMWFVRLHALFYKGEKFHQQAELEGEIMHRLEMACHIEKSTNTLLKMALVNMSAHHIAATNYAESQSLNSLRFYHFTLRFNALFVSHFCAAFEIELKEAMSDEGGDTVPTKTANITAVVEALLPVLRLYCMWLAACRSEVCAGLQMLEELAPALVQNLAKVFTLLCVFTYNQESLASCPYLLSEDLEIRGFRPLAEHNIPEPCRCFCREDGTPKTYLEISSSRLDLAHESLARVLDILRCAYHFADEDTFPLSHGIIDNWLVFEHRPEHTPSTNLLNATPVVVEASNTASRGNPIAADNQVAGHPDKAAIFNGQDQPVRNLRPASAYHQLQSMTPHDDILRSDHVDEAENTVINMLTPFLKPPTPQSHHRQGSSSNESSYGMHTNTANEILGSFQTEPSPAGSVPSGKFAQLPWAWFNTPKPDPAKDSQPSSGQAAFSAQCSPHQSPKHSSPFSNLFDDPFATPGRNQCASLVNSNEQRNTRHFSSPSLFAAESSVRGNNLPHTFSGTTVPRSSPFTQWAESQKLSQNNGPADFPWGTRALDRAPPSTGTSGFSHPSSLYQGTPANGLGLGLGTGPGDSQAA
ncbi:uncharacterized protein UV8b_03760 [Ustilaginoidea virens]|uniref:Nonsense-mediated mRNA decay factor n=1 Tax=Ustilaginoidea virens TaxID=1159556 RepID=A0A8E5HPY3_USTVR|nr:uncharacterized protein UV8b_03760 [Ustilaginoidea virens]QUC19519.1 hypothetical protein UV8b_03760 [Ustilaginoidea virens]